MFPFTSKCVSIALNEPLFLCWKCPHGNASAYAFFASLELVVQQCVSVLRWSQMLELRGRRVLGDRPLLAMLLLVLTSATGAGVNLGKVKMDSTIENDCVNGRIMNWIIHKTHNKRINIDSSEQSRQKPLC